MFPKAIGRRGEIRVNRNSFHGWPRHFRLGDEGAYFARPHQLFRD